MTYTEIYKIVYGFHRQSQKILAQKGTSPETWEVIANELSAISQRYANNYLNELLKLVYIEIARTHKQGKEQ